MKVYKGVLLFFTILFINGCDSKKTIKEEINFTQYYHSTVQNLTDVIVHDIFSPPVASRIYAYPNIAAYEVMRLGHKNKYPSLIDRLTETQVIPQLPLDNEVNYEIASLIAFINTAQALVFSESKIELYEQKIIKEFENKGVGKVVLNNSIQYGEQVAEHVLKWASSDNYKETRSFPKYTIQSDTKFWKPTPPDYMEGIEPSWNRIRPFLLDSASQFKPELPTSFSMNKESQFYRELIQVYEVVKKPTEEHTAIAQFWDCNPYVSHHSGHVMFATKKITPGGHWVGITGLAARKEKLNFQSTVECYTLSTVVMADAFISCWDEKWRSVLVRPETLINQFIDEDWVPILQTPPFPEYTSGHSVVSGAASTVLTQYFGDDFSFNDSTEIKYGLPVRSFSSFYAAADEAAISRLYGGIHYMPAIRNGLKQGKDLAIFSLSKLDRK